MTNVLSKLWSRFFSGTLIYQFFDTSYIALQQNFAESVNVGLLRVVKRRPEANGWRVLCCRCLFVPSANWQLTPLDTMCVAYLSSIKLCGLGNNTSTTFSCRINHVILAPHGHVANRPVIWSIFLLVWSKYHVKHTVWNFHSNILTIK